jgi:hypothetical protein
MLNRVLIVLFTLTLFACYNSVVHVREDGLACESDSDCDVEYVCVRNIAPGSVLGECIHESSYDPWKNRELPNIINLKNKDKNKKIKKLDN